MKKFNRYKIAQFIALGATVSSVAGLIIILAAKEEFGLNLITIGFIAGLVSYIFGGLGTALKMAWNIAKFGWVVVPFPCDIPVGILTFICALAALVLLPIIPVRKAYKEHMYS